MGSQSFAFAAPSPSPFGLSNNIESRTVWVGGLPRDVSEQWLRSSFGHAGPVERVDLYTPDEGPTSAFVTFASPVHAHSAQIMWNGQSLRGAPIRVQSASSVLQAPTRPRSVIGLPFQGQPPRAPAALHNMGHPFSPRSSPVMSRYRPQEGMPLTHKNLYVLNLPLDATTDQLTALFSKCGEVVHCVILAMLDAQARRRGFIDMKAPAEAKEAIETLNGFVWNGYPIEVSYAIVQRSGGPLDPASAAGRNVIKRNVPRNRFNTGPRRVPSDSGFESPFPAFDQFSSGRSTPMHGGVVQTCHNPYTNGSGIGTPPFGGPIDRNAYGDGAQAGKLEYESSASIDKSPSPNARDPRSFILSGLDPAAVLDDEDLRRFVKPYGAVSGASLTRDERGVSRGYGLVTFYGESDANRARRELQGRTVHGRRLDVHDAFIPTSSKPPTPLPPPASQPAGLYSSIHAPPMHSGAISSRVWEPPVTSTTPFTMPINRTSSEPRGGAVRDWSLAAPNSASPPGSTSDSSIVFGVRPAATDNIGIRRQEAARELPGPDITMPLGHLPPSLFQPIGPARPVRIQADPSTDTERGQLAEAFEPRDLAAPAAAMPGSLVFASTNTSPETTRSNKLRGHAQQASVGSLSPPSNISVGSTASSNSQVNTPEAFARGHGLGFFGGQHEHVPPAVEAKTKHADIKDFLLNQWPVTHSTYESLGLDLPAETSGFSALQAWRDEATAPCKSLKKQSAPLAPVGHEKLVHAASNSSSPSPSSTSSSSACGRGGASNANAARDEMSALGLDQLSLGI